MKVVNPEAMTLEQSLEHWKEVLSEYDSAWDEFMDTFPRKTNSVLEKHRKATQRVWKATAHLLREYTRVKVQYGVTLEPMPVILFSRLALHFDDLGSGVMPDVFEKARDDGRAYSHFHRELLAKAVYFLSAVEAGEIECRAPTKTVARHFNVTEQTVRNWRKRAEEFCHDIPRPHVGMLVQAMEDAGRKYSVLGRGAPSQHS
jgi:hypothetical protein